MFGVFYKDKELSCVGGPPACPAWSCRVPVTLFPLGAAGFAGKVCRMCPGVGLLLLMERVPMSRPQSTAQPHSCHPTLANGVTTSQMSPLFHLAEWEEPTPLQTGPLTQRTLLFLKGVIKFNCQLRSDNVGSAQHRPSPAAGSRSSTGTPPCPQSLIPQEPGAAALHAALLSASSQELKSDLF